MKHTVRQGECLATIARQYGFASYKTLYFHADNAALRARRPNPNVLHPGDVVAIPDLAEKEASVPTAKVSRFQVKRPRKLLRLAITDAEGKPLKGEDYAIEIGSETREGQTNGDGFLEERIPDDTQVASLWIAGRVFHLRLGTLNPARDTPDDGMSGVQARLANLGYTIDVDGKMSARTKAAIAMFQADAGLPITGEPDAATRDGLIREHGC
ncbi:MAG: peptidoglycan-binding protein [Minicystis sp.]